MLIFNKCHVHSFNHAIASFRTDWIRNFLRENLLSNWLTRSIGRVKKNLMLKSEIMDDSAWPSFINKNLSSLQSSFKELDLMRENKKFRPVFLARIVSWILKKIVRSNTQYVTGLEINVQSNKNRYILRGKVDTLELKFDTISFCNIFVSGGGRLIIKGLDLRVRRFLFQNLQSIRKPYIIYCDLLFSQLDIMNSGLIRNLMQLLVDTILANVFSQIKGIGIDTSRLFKAEITKVTINSRRIYVQGTAKFISDNSNYALEYASLDFEVSSGAGMRSEGQILYLKDIKVLLNPKSVLRTDIPIILTNPIDVDLGDNFRVESLVIANKNVWIRAASVISPIDPFYVSEPPSRALYRYDVSVLLSSLLRLNGGVALRWAVAV